MSKVKAIIPCAGYGTRMQMESWQAKEMLRDPNDPSKVLIDYSMELCYKYNIEPVVITRREKTGLIDYLIKDHQLSNLIITEPGKEWAETVLKSQGLWGEKNILILPDTRFNPESVIPEMLDKLDKVPVVAAIHSIDPKESYKWGTVDEDNGSIFEKENTNLNKAWGLLGFQKGDGRCLFNNLHPRGEWVGFLEEFMTVDLTDFKDITRTGKLEKY